MTPTNPKYLSSPYRPTSWPGSWFGTLARKTTFQGFNPITSCLSVQTIEIEIQKLWSTDLGILEALFACNLSQLTLLLQASPLVVLPCERLLQDDVQHLYLAALTWVVQ